MKRDLLRASPLPSCVFLMKRVCFVAEHPILGVCGCVGLEMERERLGRSAACAPVAVRAGKALESMQEGKAPFETAWVDV